MESGVNEISRIALPAVLEIQAGINHPRYASLKGIMAAKKKEIANVAPADLGLDAGQVGAAGSRIEIVSVAFPESGTGAQMIEGDARGRGQDAGRQAPARKRGCSDGEGLGGPAAARGGQLPRISWEALGRGAEAGGAALGGKAEAVVLGAGVGLAAAEVAKNDLAAVHVADHEALRSYTPGAYLGALAPAIQAAKPDYVVFPHTYQSVDYVPRLAQAVDAGLITEATGFEVGRRGAGLEASRARRQAPARVRVKGEGTVLVSVQSGAFPADAVVKAARPRSSRSTWTSPGSSRTARSSATRRSAATRST